MTDGLSEANRQAEAGDKLDEALDVLDEALHDIHDRIFGLPESVRQSINSVLNKYGLSASR